MTSMKDMRSYLKRVAEQREKTAADTTDTEAGVLKQAKKVVHKVVLEGKGPIAAQPLNVASITHEGEASTVKAPKTRRQRQALLEDVDASASKKPKLDEGVVSWSDTLTEFTGEGEVKSLWDRRFPVGTFVLDHLWTEEDRGRVTAVGPDQAVIALQSLGLKIASISRTFGEEFSKLRAQERNNRKALDAANKTLASQPDLAKEVEELKAEVARLRQAAAEQENARKEREQFLKKTYDDTIEEWTAKVKSIRVELDTKSANLAEKDKEIEDLKMQAAEYMMNGFEKAKIQIEALYPNLDFAELSIFKTVVDGKVVDEAEETTGNAEDGKLPEAAADIGENSSSALC